MTDPFPPREFVALPVEISLLVFHVSVSVFISAKIVKRHQLYSKPFFRLYLVQCVSNYMCYASLVGLRFAWFFTVLASPLYPNGIEFNTFYQFSHYFQLATYTAITLNRWTAIIFPLEYQHASMWKGFRLWLCVILAITLSLGLALVRPILTAYLAEHEAKLDEAWITAGLVRAALLTVTNIVVTALNVLLQVWSFVHYRRMDAQCRKQNKENFRLLIFTVMELGFQLLKIAYYAMISMHVDVSLFSMPSSYLRSAQALSGPILLLIVGPSLRRGYARFYGFVKTPDAVTLVSITNSSDNFRSRRFTLPSHFRPHK